MTPKGHSPVDLDPAAPATSRRGLIGALGAVGLAGAAALSIARPASAAPTSPTDSDKELLFQAMRLELTAAALYDTSLAAGLSDVGTELATVFSANHRAYADKIAGSAGFSSGPHLAGEHRRFGSRPVNDGVLGRQRRFPGPASRPERARSLDSSPRFSKPTAVIP